MEQLYKILVLLAYMAQTCYCAERVDAKMLIQEAIKKRHADSEPMTSHLFTRDVSKLQINELDDVAAVGPNTKLEVVKTASSAQGTKLVKMQEKYKDRPVLDAIVTLETDTEGGHVLDASGSFYRDLESDLDHQNELNPEEALALCLQDHKDEGLRDEITDVETEEEVMIDHESAAYPVYLVKYLIMSDFEERRPSCIVHAVNRTVLYSWDDLESCRDCTAQGTGGNLQIGKIRYGELQNCLNVRRENGTCYLENEYVRVIDNNRTFAEWNENVTADSPIMKAASYDCVAIDDETNGAYSPLLDALFYGTVVGRMFEEWYNTSPLGERMTFRVHTGRDMVNAFWNGKEAFFGDGGGDYHPLVVPDIVGHEVGHGVTQKNSGLFYFDQWGGLNEAFSDMMGETTQEYLWEADWVTGLEISRKQEPHRYYYRPELDNESISHVDDFNSTMDVHHSSGVYNYVFYLLVHNYTIPIKDAFGVFLHANTMYWHHMSSYVTAACDVMKAAYDLGQDGGKFRQAFQEVGIDVCDIEDHILGLKSGVVQENIKVSKEISPMFRFIVPAFAKRVTVNATSSNGEIYIFVSRSYWGSLGTDKPSKFQTSEEKREESEETITSFQDKTAEGENVELLAYGFGFVQFSVPANTTRMRVFIKLISTSATPLENVRLEAKYVCGKIFTYNDFSSFRSWMDCPKVSEDDEDDETPSDDEPDEKEDEEDGSKEENENDGDEEENEENDTTPEMKEPGMNETEVYMVKIEKLIF